MEKVHFLPVVLALLVVLVLNSVDARAVSSVNYLGRTTWTGTITDDSDNPANIGDTFTLTGGISRVGDEFYLFQGYVTLPDDGPFIMSGSGALIGSTLYLTISESQKHTDSAWRDSGVMHVSLDKATMNGNFFDIALSFNSTTRMFDQGFTAGTLSRTGATVPLSTTLAPQQLLLREEGDR